MPRPSHLPNFSAPPVGEMLIGVQFGHLEGFQAVHLGKLHDVYANDYPKVAQVAPLAPSFEYFGIPNAAAEISFGVRIGPELPRIWFLTKDEDRLVQFQVDRLILNWRKLSDDSVYPRYESLESSFQDAYEKLKFFCDNQKISSPKINQCEVTYVNHISRIGGRSTTGDAARVLRCWRSDCVSELGTEIENTEIKIRRIISGNDGKPFARMLIEAAPQYSIGAGHVRIALNLTVRGAPRSSELYEAIEFFRMAREQIVTSFAKVTAEELHHDWGREQ